MYKLPWKKDVQYMFPPKGYPYSAVSVSCILFKTMQRYRVRQTKSTH